MTTEPSGCVDRLDVGSERGISRVMLIFFLAEAIGRVESLTETEKTEEGAGFMMTVKNS